MTIFLALLPFVALFIFWILLSRRVKGMTYFGGLRRGRTKQVPRLPLFDSGDPGLGDEASATFGEGVPASELLEEFDPWEGMVIEEDIEGPWEGDMPDDLRELLEPKDDEELRKRRIAMIAENIRLREEVKGTVVVVVGPNGIVCGAYGPVADLRGDAYADVVRRANVLNTEAQTTTTVVRLQPIEGLFEDPKQ